MREVGDIPIVASGGFHHTYFTDGIKQTSHTLSAPYVDIQHRQDIRKSIAPHRLDFYMIALIKAGEGTQVFGSRPFKVKENMLIFSGPNVITSWKSNESYLDAYYCTFSEDFYNIGFVNKQLLSCLPFFQIDQKPVLCLTDDQMTIYLSLFGLMQTEFAHGSNSSDEVLRNLIHALLNKANANYPTQTPEPLELNSNRIRLLRGFKQLYMKDFYAIREGKALQLKRISEYADELHISQNYLNDTIKSFTGETAARLIDKQLIKQANMCLINSSKTVSEIGYLLGFDDSSHFAKFYKRHTGKTPSQFRSAHQAVIFNYR